MKRANAFRITAVICVFTFLAIPLTACGAKTFNIENITRIELADGTTGKVVEINEPDIIQELIQPFNNTEFKKGESTKNQAGWSYWLKFYQGDKLTTSIVVHGHDGNRISFNDSFYDMSEAVISADTYRELLANKESLYDGE